MKRTLTTVLLPVLLALAAMAQAGFTVSYKRVSPTEIDIIFNGNIEAGWHLYAADLPEGGPMPTALGTDALQGARLKGGLRQGPGKKNVHDEVFDMQVSYFIGHCTFTQRIELTAANYLAEGWLEYQVCKDDGACVPGKVDFRVAGTDGAGEPSRELPRGLTDDAAGAPAAAAAPGDAQPDAAAPAADASAVSQNAAAAPQAVGGALWQPVTDELRALGGEAPAEGMGLWQVFLLGMLGGLVALCTPCVWPIIPMTVSFFLKRSADKARGVRDAVLYGVSIVVIYVSLGLAVTSLLGASALNDLSTNALFNIFFFLMLVVFAASFLGGFEITLPARWTAAVDGKAERATGLLSIFLMAFTLSLVSFSCTGPIIGFLLVEASTSGGPAIVPAVGMLGFALALALPFTLFALFPAWLKSAPRSGGWLNAVKVTLGFLELAFALKFLSVADLAYGWHLLDRETFLALWIAIFALLGLYLLGKIRFSHDGDGPSHVGVPRFMLALCSLAFAVYMLPGLWGAPLRAVSAFAPPMSTQDFNLDPVKVEPRFTDYDEAMAYARQAGKPLVVDFTGHGCVNCRQMEMAVWHDAAVRDLLMKDYVLVSLYVDDKTRLPEPLVVTENGREVKLRTVGDKWSYLQRTKFGANAQPFYVLLGPDGHPLAGAYTFDTDPQRFTRFLRGGLDRFAGRQKEGQAWN